MKKLVMTMWMSVMMAVAAGACVDDEAASPAPEVGAPALDEGAPLSAEQRAALEANPQLEKMRAELARGGASVSLDEARVFQRGDQQGIACPVSGPNGQPGQFSHLTVQQRAGGEATLSLEPTEGYSPSAGVFGDAASQAAGVQCEPDWWPTRVIGRYCDWAWACGLGDATFVVKEAVRSCCAIGVGCWEERTHLTSRERCGC